MRVLVFVSIQEVPHLSKRAFRLFVGYILDIRFGIATVDDTKVIHTDGTMSFNTDR